MKFRIRSKFVGILIIASLLPLFIGLWAFNWFGRDHYRRAQGVICETAATQLALSISRSLRHQIDLLYQWTAIQHIPERTLALSQSPNSNRSVQQLDQLWPSLDPGAPEVAATLENPLAAELKEFQKRNPLFAEIIITDRSGRLLAATNKTTDFAQADEVWWQQGASAKPGNAYLEGLNFDQSSGAHSIELALPLFNSGQLVGVLKGVINVMPFLQQFPPSIGYVPTVHEVISSTGDIISRLGDRELQPFDQKSAAATLFTQLRPGWGEAHLQPTGKAIVGFAPIGSAAISSDDLRIQGLRPLWAVAYRDEKAAMAPVHSQMQLISLLGAFIAVGFVFLGYQIASKKIIAPINSLRRAAQAISRTVKLGDQTDERQAARSSSALLKAVDAIQTNDEIEDLAAEFAFMGKRILSYHQLLESEIAEKTGELRRDLEFARQFQVNLMPRKYPVVHGGRSRVGLHFHHYYRPATTMGGDFFNILKLGDNQAGVFIADVMGHGARSALATAIIATLLQNLERRSKDPALALTLLNRHFHKVVSNAGDLLFVTAFYLVLDTETMTATYASAGHPSPLLLNRQLGQAVELTPHLKNNPALGLFASHSYQTFTRPLTKGDLFLLFTDGLFECVDARGTQLGRDGLKRLVQLHQDADLRQFTTRILESVKEFTGGRDQEDDVCLLGVEVS